LVLIGLVRLLPRVIAAGWAIWLGDRLLLCLLLAGLAAGQVIAPAVPALVLLLIVAGLVLNRGPVGAAPGGDRSGGLTRA